MQRKELRALKRIYATPTMRRIAQDNKLDKPIVYKYSWHKYTYSTKYDMMLRCQSRGSILMIAVFFPDDVAKGFKYPVYEIYCNPKGCEYITRERNPEDGKEIRWTNALVFNLERIDTIRFFDYEPDLKIRKRTIWQNNDGKKEIKQFLGTNMSGLEGLIEYQHRCKSYSIKKAEEKEQEPWDEELALTPPVLKGFERWSKHEAMNENFIFYESIHSPTGYCSYCEKEVPLIKPKRNGEGKCPCCHKKIIFKLRSKIKGLRTRAISTSCIQRIEGGYVVRTFEVNSAYRNATYDKPDWSFIEYQRTFMYSDGRITTYEYETYKNKYLRFCKQESKLPYEYYNRKIKLYPRNLSLLKKSVLRNSAIDLWPILPYSPAKYLYVEKGNPAIEMLAKIKLFGLAKEIIKTGYDKNLLNQDETELAKMLKIDNARLKRLKNMTPTLVTLKWMQYEKLANTIWPDDMISEFGQNEIEVSELNFLPKPIKYLKVYNYIRRQQILSGETFKQTFITYRDYYYLAEENKWNIASTQISMPKNLEQAHMNAILFSRGTSIKNQTEKLEKKWPLCNKILPDLKKYEYSNNEYSVVAPVCIEDMVREGIALNHCMDHADFYYDRIQQREAYPFFLRKTNQKDMPWYTLEVEASGNIRQKRTTGDNQNPDLEPAIPFLYEFMEHFEQVMNAEDIKQGIKADKKRKEEYKKLREEQKKVWRGKLAGQLLADVLEADFMQAI